MEFKNNSKRFNQVQRVAIAEQTLEIKEEVERNKPKSYYCEKKRRWIRPSSQVGFKAEAVRAIFSDMKDEPNGTREWNLAVKLIDRCLEQKASGALDNPDKNRQRVEGAGAPVRAQEVRSSLFAYFIDVRECLKGRLPKKVFIAKAVQLHELYCDEMRNQGKNEEKLVFSDRWFQG